ncbi:hypothetical protein ES703_107554 [subsurface metagenome]
MPSPSLSMVSFFAVATSYFSSKAGLPNHGLDGSTWPLAGLARPFIRPTTASRSIARLSALRRRMSVQGEPGSTLR